MAAPSVALALQGGGSHGAFTWGVLDRILLEVEAGRLKIAAISGASAGAINATLVAAGLAEGGPASARMRLSEFWHALAATGARLGNGLFGFAEPGPLGGFNIDWSPGAIFLEAAGLVVSPYTNPFYSDTLAPLLEQVLPPERLARLNGRAGPRLFLSADNVADDSRKLFSHPEVTFDALRASACLPTEFRAVHIDGAPYWDGGYLGNPALTPLLDMADDLLLVMVNPLQRADMPPRNARAILNRLNEVTFNASVVLELNAIAGINRLLQELRDAGIDYHGTYKTVNVHLIRDDAYLAQLGFVSKTSTSLPFLLALHDEGVKAASRFFTAHCDKIGACSSADIKTELTGPMLKG